MSEVPGGPDWWQASTSDGRLSDAARNRKLDEAIRSADRPVITPGWHIHEPIITVDHSTFSAKVVWGKTFASPSIVILLALLSFVTCGLFLPIWFVMTLRRNRYAKTLFIDEQGLAHWGTAAIPPGQRLVSLLIFIGIICWIIWLSNLWQSTQAVTY